MCPPSIPRTRQRTPRVLSVDLDRWGPRQTPGEGTVESHEFVSATPRIDHLGRMSGAALAVALLLDARGEADLIVAVGDAVRRGLPTAARASVAARSPLSGRLAEGQVGSDLARRLARVCDALHLRGQVSLLGAVLQIREAGHVRLHSMPELEGAGVHETLARLEQRFGSTACLCIGPAGEALLPFANLAAAADPPSFVGRGGLGAAFGTLGLKALVVDAAPVREHADRELLQALRRSPRLLARAEGGTLELERAFRARGDLAQAAAGRDLADEAREQATSRHGCKGCPTPCGWVFEGEVGRGGMRFSAAHALGERLGFEGLEAPRVLLGLCDGLGLDALEAGSCLALLQSAQTPLARGDLEGCVQALEELARGEVRGEPLAGGARDLARRLGLELPQRAGLSARPTRDLATQLGQVVSVRGVEPMRSFPFLVSDGTSRERLEHLLAPLSLPPGAEDPLDPAGKGRLVWWHENLVAALDVLGFCAFSAAGLLADGVLDLDELGEALGLPELPGICSDPAPAARLQALGAHYLAAVHELHDRWGCEKADEGDWSRALLDRPTLVPEYKKLRGTHPARDGALDLQEAAQRLGPASESVPTQPAELPSGAVHTGQIVLLAGGSLGAALRSPRSLELPLPAPLSRVLAQALEECPAAAIWLGDPSEPIPAVWSAGQRLGVRDLVRDGDALELVIAVSGG